MRVALEQLEPAKELVHFVTDYGTGNSISDPPPFIPYDVQDPASTSQSVGATRPADFTRVSRKVGPTYQSSQQDLREQQTQSEAPHADPVQVNGRAGSPNLAYIQPRPEAVSQQPSVSNQSPPNQQQPLQLSSRSDSRDDGAVPTSNWSQPPTGPPSMAPPPPPPAEVYVAPPPTVSRPPSPRRVQRASQPLPIPQLSQRQQDHPPMPNLPPPAPPSQMDSGILFYGTPPPYVMLLQ